MSGPTSVTGPPPVPEKAPGARPAPALRADALPTDTAIRFVLLILAVVAATLYLFQALWFVLRGQLFVDSVRRCGAVAGELATGLPSVASAEMQRMAACRADMSQEQAFFAIAGSLLILGAAWVAYRFWPAWRERRRRLQPMDPYDGKAVFDEVTALSSQAGLERPPAVRLDAANPNVQAYVYGAGTDLRVAMTGGLVVQQALDPPAFRAVLRHELAHVANRDVPWTYYTVATWWTFVGLALLPIAAIFVVSEPAYVLRLGWRTGLLALLVALVAASVLRAREAFADATSAAWGSHADLDRVLAAQRPSRGRRPRQLRVHPTPAERRALLADPDRLFHADWFTLLATGIASGAALDSLWSIADLALPAAAMAVSVLLLAPLIAAVLCVSAWRVGLREAVRGERRPAALPLGLALGVGLAIAPVLSFTSAVGGVASGVAGWTGYIVWSVLMVVGAVLVTQWVADSARVRVASVLGRPTPRRALAGHIVATSLMLALLLACGYSAHVLLVSRGPSMLGLVPVWLGLASVSLGNWASAAPLVAAAAAVAVPLLGWRDLAATSPGITAGWPWRDALPGPTTGADLLRSSRPRLLPVLGIGLAAGATAVLALIGGRLVTAQLPDLVRRSDALDLTLWSAIQGSVAVAALVATLAAALTLRVRWWPIALLAAFVAAPVTSLGALAVDVAAGCGVLPSVHPDCSPPGWTLTRLVISYPATQAASLVFVLAAGLAVIRSWPRREAGGVQQVRSRAIVAGLAAVGAVAVSAGALNMRVLSVEVPYVSGPGYVVEVPVPWNGTPDPATETTVFVNLAQDVQVLVRPIEAPARPATGEWLDVGGRRAFLVFTQQQGGVHLRAYEVQAPAGAYRVVVVGTEASLEQRQEELVDLLRRVRWSSR